MIVENAMHFIAVGSLLGLSAGISPGPLLTLVLTQTIRHNRKEGIKVAITPLITDLPIIFIALLVFNKLSQFNTILAMISFTGAFFIAYLGYHSLKTNGLKLEVENAKSKSLIKGIIANFVNPAPYLFWSTVGAPLVFKALDISLLSAILYLFSFYVFLIGSKISLVLIVAKTKAFIGQKLYINLMRALGIVLIVFSIIFFYDGIQYLKK